MLATKLNQKIKFLEIKTLNKKIPDFDLKLGFI